MASRDTRLVEGRHLLLGLACAAFGLATALPTTVAQSDEADDGAGPMASFLAELLGPDESFEPVEIELTGSLPRRATFQGIELSVDRVHLTNIHPYTLFGEPTPGELYYVVVELTASNPTEVSYEYQLGDETFELRTWSGRLLPHVPAPGVYDLSRLEPGETKTDELVFGSETPDVLDGAALLVGRAPDASLVIPFTAPPLIADYPAPVALATPGPFQAGAVAWSVEAGEAGLDRPAGVCCPDTGSRADVGEFFLTLELVGTVSGSKYGQATVASDALRLVVDGEPTEPFGFDGQANVPEGEAYAFPATWIAHEGDDGLTLQLIDRGEIVASVPVLVGEDAIAAAATVGSASSSTTADASPVASPPPSDAPSASSGVAPGSSSAAAATPTPSVAATPTPRPVLAAIVTLLLYSGVPDPGWSLTQDDLDALASIAATLTPIEGVPPEGDLGYRGFRVTGPQGTWRANGGVVMTPDSAPGTSLADPDRLVERYLLGSGADHVTADEAAIATEAIEATASPTPS